MAAPSDVGDFSVCESQRTPFSELTKGSRDEYRDVVEGRVQPPSRVPDLVDEESSESQGETSPKRQRADE